MIAQLTNHLWQSTFFAAVAALLVVMFRKNRAQVRYWLWLAASLKFLAPFSILMSLASRVEWAPAAKMAAPVTVAASFVQISEPFTAELTSSTAAPVSAHVDWVPLATLGVWACGFVAVALWRLRAWRRIRAAVRASTCDRSPEGTVEIRLSPDLFEPGVVGVFRPILLLPAGIAERLTPDQLAAVLAHELCHVRRRDNLFSAIHMILEAVFWFHPLVWWIGARLVEERERACDEEVLRQGLEPLAYAEGILNVCKLYMESPLLCVSGVTGSDLKRRIHEILAGQRARDLSFARKATLAAIGIAALAAPIALGILHAPTLRAQAVASSAPKFEVASIKPCKSGDMGGEGKGDTKAGSGRSSSPGRLSTPCRTVEEFVHSAYVSYGNGYLSRDPSNPPVEGGPDWIRSNRYQIDAKAEGTPGEGVMNGPMLRALLEERLKLRIHREARDMPVYALTAAKGGPKLPPFQEGSCIPLDVGRVMRPQPENMCKVMVGRPKGSNLTLIGPGLTLSDLTKMLYLIVDRPVIDRTGIQGRFDIQLTFAREEGTPAFVIGGAPPGWTPPVEPSDEPAAPSIFAVLEKVGLKLEKARGPRDFVVIDHVEKPSEN